MEHRGKRENLAPTSEERERETVDVASDVDFPRTSSIFFSICYTLSSWAGRLENTMDVL